MNTPNMSYCMFHNTRAAMQQVIWAMEQQGADLLADMHEDERRAFDALMQLCETYNQLAEEVQEEFAELDVNFG